MRSQHRSFFATMIIVSLCCGFIGCKSNGGSWYKPNSYTWHNPFKKAAMEEDEYGQFAEDNSGIKLPKDGQIPDLDTPAGGYSNDQFARNNTRSNLGASTAMSTNAPRTGIPTTGTPNYSGSTGSYQTPAVAMNNGVQPANYQSQGQTPSSGYYQNNGQYTTQAPQGGTMQQPNPNYGQQPYSTQYPPTSNQQQYTTPPQGTYDSFGTQTQQQPQNGYATGQNNYTSTPSYDGSEYRPGSR